jgi:hypothetical protein
VDLSLACICMISVLVRRQSRETLNIVMFEVKWIGNDLQVGTWDLCYAILGLRNIIKLKESS